MRFPHDENGNNDLDTRSELNGSRHISHRYDEELEGIRTEVLRLSALVEQQVSHGMAALLTLNAEMGQDVALSDYRVNAMEVEIDQRCTEIVARRQPTARDLRLILSVIKVIADLERIGDQAERLGRSAIEMASSGADNDLLGGVENLGRNVRHMLRATMDAFARMDVDAALETAAVDAKINREYDGVVRQLITHMMEDPRKIKNALSILWCARSLERIANYCCNICETTVYAVSGRNIRHTSLEQVRNEFAQGRQNV